MNLETLNKFKKISNYPIKEFFDAVGVFYSTKYQKIVDFYSGNLKFIDKEYLKLLDNLEEESVKLLNIFREKKKLMNTVDFWELLQVIEELKTKLKTTQNISKYLRSSIIKGKVQSGYVYSYDMKNNERFEDIARTELNRTDEQNEWMDIAQINLINSDFQNDLVTTMIDNTIGKRIFGKDLPTRTKFEDDDLKVLNYDETLNQTILILTKLTKGDVPEFQSLGINADLYKGVNFSQLSFDSLGRELARNFSSDDLFKDFKINDIRHENGDVFISFDIGTKIGLVIQDQQFSL